MAQRPARTDWLHRFPPLHTPRFRRTHLSRDLDRALFVGFCVGMGHLFVLMLALGLWAAEIEAWLLAWTYYGTFLGARWIWRHNPLGQTVAAVTPGPKPHPYDPHGTPAQPVDLAQFGEQRRGDMRRRD